MFTAFENCKSIEEVANNAARFERMNLKREYTKNSNEIFSIPTTYEFYYENSEMKLLEDVITYVEYTKKQWEKEKKKKESREKNNYFVRKLDRKLVDDGIDHIATDSHYILRVARKISEQTQMPTFIIYNARAATIYSNILEDKFEIFYKNGIKRTFKLPVSNLTKLVEDFERQNVQSCIIPIRNMKISSHQYVQTDEEVKKLGKDGISNLLRRHFNDPECVVNEEIPNVFIECLRCRCSVIFVDVPTWGVGYASSAGLLRKQKDIDKRNKGIYFPYKFRSYVEYANYQVASFSMSRFWNEEPQIDIEEENLTRIDKSQPVALILNPEIEQLIWWDDSPQFYEAKWAKYSDSSIERNPLYVVTTFGRMNIAKYIIKKIKGATIKDELYL